MYHLCLWKDSISLSEKETKTVHSTHWKFHSKEKTYFPHSTYRHILKILFPKKWLSSPLQIKFSKNVYFPHSIWWQLFWKNNKKKYPPSHWKFDFQKKSIFPIVHNDNFFWKKSKKMSVHPMVHRSEKILPSPPLFNR